MRVIDIELEFNAATIALNKRWAGKQRLNPMWVQAKKDLRAELTSACRDVGRWKPLEGAVRMGIFCTTECDIDAPEKAILDAGNKLVYADDSQVEELIVKVIRYPLHHVLALAVEPLCDPEESIVFARYGEWREYALRLGGAPCAV